ncbi:unnamed protein product [Larinioides sclopetarius]|uniref:Membralin n=1 Tax=Larinioides sclopetarius TaxID=280406 RepID=A0AAV2BP36_9ARAC
MPRHLFQVTVNLPGSFRNNINNNEAFNPYVFVRNRLYHFLFHRFALLYARLFSRFHRQLIEFFILLTAFFSFILLVYVHVVFVQTPITCLEDYRDVWKRGDILRVEVLSGKGKENYTLQDSYFKEKAIRLQYLDGQARYFYSDHQKRTENEEIFPFIEDVDSKESVTDQNALEAFSTLSTDDHQVSKHLESDSKLAVEAENFQTLSEASILASDPNDAYIMEFSLEYGYLRLRPSKRKDLNISVVFVILDPEENTCFGGAFNRFLLDNFLGYDNVLLASIKNMVEAKNTKGFVRNVVMEIEYIFINNWTNEKSFFTAAFVMVVFTLTISTLLRHSHHQIFIVVANIFDAVWPRNFIPTSGAPVLTVILALVGMEAVMSDFFHDRSIALHIIVIVWFADLYDAVCCQSPLSRRHWFRFFYLYHFLFYAYNYKFSGVYWPLSLMTSWLFILHSMVFFFHHYELPRFLHRAAFFNATRNPHGNTVPPQPNSHHGNDPSPPSNQDPTNEPSAPSDHPEVSNDHQPNGNESNQPDQLHPADNLVNEGVSAANYVPLTESAVDAESRSSNINCCNDCHSFQIKSDIDSEVHTCFEENPTTSVSAAEGSSLEPKDTIVECDQKGGNEAHSSGNFSCHQICEPNNNEFSEGRNAEKFVVEGIFKDRKMFDKSKKCNLNVDQEVEKQENAHSGDGNDLYSRELSVD